MASVSARRMRSASSACDGSATTTVAVVPKARKDRVAMQDCADASVEVVTSATWRPRWRQDELSSWWAAGSWWSAERWSWSALGMAKHHPGPMRLAKWWVAKSSGSRCSASR